MPDVFLRPFATNPYDIILYDTSLLPIEYPILLTLVTEPASGRLYRLSVRRKVFCPMDYGQVWGDTPPRLYIVYEG